MSAPKSDLQPPLTAPVEANPARRKYLLAAATAGVAAGVGLAWWWRAGRSAEPEAPLDSSFWALQWDTPDGQKLSMSAFQGRPVLLNFWATWCTPCVEELPLLNDFYRSNKASGWQVLALAVDRVEPVRQFLRQNALDFPVGMAGVAGSELGRSLGNLAGGLPFSVVVGSAGSVQGRKLGKLKHTDLEQWRQLK